MSSTSPTDPTLKLVDAEAPSALASNESGTRRACRVWEVSDYVGDWKMSAPAAVTWSYVAHSRIIAREVPPNDNITRIEEGVDSDAIIPRYGDCSPLPLDFSMGTMDLSKPVQCVDAQGTPFEVTSTAVEMLAEGAAKFTMIVVLQHAKAGEVRITTQVEIERVSSAVP